MFYFSLANRNVRTGILQMQPEQMVPLESHDGGLFSRDMRAAARNMFCLQYF